MAAREPRAPVTRTHITEHRLRCGEVQIGFVSELCHIPPETPVKHRDLRGYAGAHRCCGKSLVGTALVRFDVRQHARAESIFKRAPSTTRTSLHFRINGLRAVRHRLSHTPARSERLARSPFHSAVCSLTRTCVRGNCVRPSNLLRSLTGARDKNIQQGPLSRSCAPLWLRPAAQSPDIGPRRRCRCTGSLPWSSRSHTPLWRGIACSRMRR
jgi:hypothetical protein